MIGWLIYNKDDAKKNAAYIKFYIEEGKKKEIEIILIYREELEFGLVGGKYHITYLGNTVILPDFAICRTIYALLSKHLEIMGIPVFNKAIVADICNDKAKTYQYVAQAGIPIIDTCFVRNNELRDYLKKVVNPTVVKAVDGHGGSQVFLVEEKDLNNPEMMEGSDLVIQPLTGKKNSDLRVYVIGKEIVAAVMRTAGTGFRSNYSLGGHIHLHDLSETEKVTVEKIINLFDFGMVGIDFLIGDQGELIFNEIEDVVGARMLYSCSDINLVGLYLDFIRNQLV
jgi:gamma-F420-2:alpha-L-glutamate ligase